jgi:ubiquitin C-terminal hydrolase
VRRFFTSKDINIEHTGQYSITLELVNLLRELWKDDDGSRIVMPHKFIDALYEKFGNILQRGEQHDVCEVCTLLCDKIAEECFNPTALKKYTLSREDISYWNGINKQYTNIMIRASDTMRRLNAKNECEWLNMIQGVIVAQVQCLDCGETYHNFEPFIVLNIEVPDDAKTLHDCLDAFFREEHVHDWTCDKCKGRRGSRLTRLWKMPRVFCVNLKRFVGMSKNERHIDIPEEFQLSPKSVIGPQYIHRKNNVRYHLSGIALHHGSIWGGHYTAICRGYDESWVHCDDTSCNVRVPNPNVTESYMMIYELPKN